MQNILWIPAIINSPIGTMPINLHDLNGKGVHVTARTMQKTVLECQATRWLQEGKKVLKKKKTYHNCQSQMTTQYVLVLDCLNKGHLSSSEYIFLRPLFHQKFIIKRAMQILTLGLFLKTRNMRLLDFCTKQVRMRHAGMLETELPRYRSLHLKSPVPASGLTLVLSFHSRKKMLILLPCLREQIGHTIHSLFIPWFSC